jgi:hypothetical protein
MAQRSPGGAGAHHPRQVRALDAGKDFEGVGKEGHSIPIFSPSLAWMMVGDPEDLSSTERQTLESGPSRSAATQR